MNWYVARITSEKAEEYGAGYLFIAAPNRFVARERARALGFNNYKDLFGSMRTVAGSYLGRRLIKLPRDKARDAHAEFNQICEFNYDSGRVKYATIEKTDG